jgi:hypothetical protein
VNTDPDVAHATQLAFISQPDDTTAETIMLNGDSSQTHVQVAGLTADGETIDPNYAGTVTLGFGNNPTGAQFIDTGDGVLNVSDPHVSTLTEVAAGGVADFAPIVVDTLGFDYTLTGTDNPGLTGAESVPFTVADKRKLCEGDTSCVLNHSDPDTHSTGQIQAKVGGNDTVLTTTFGGDVEPIAGCGVTPGHSSILTVTGERAKIIKLVLEGEAVAGGKTNKICFGAPYPWVARDPLTGKRTPAVQNPANNNEYEGFLRMCGKVQAKNTPCIKDIKWKAGDVNHLAREAVFVVTDGRDPKIMIG